MNKRMKKLAAPSEEEARITDLERQLAEAQGKLETLQAHHALHCGCGKPLDRILKGMNDSV